MRPADRGAADHRATDHRATEHRADAGSSDLERVREGLHGLVADVVERPDALARIMSKASRTRRRDPLWGGMGLLAAGAVAALLAFLLVPTDPSSPPDSPGAAELTDTANGYLAQTRPGVVQEFRLDGPPAGMRARFETGRARGLVVADEHVYTVAERPGRQDVVDIGAGTPRTVRSEKGPIGQLSAAGTGIAYTLPEARRIAVAGVGQQRWIPVPRDLRVLDVALAPDGRLAVVLAGDRPATELRVLPPGTQTLDAAPPLRTVAGCGPAAVSWSRPGARALVAALRADCSSTPAARVVNLDPVSGRQRGGSAPLGGDEPAGRNGAGPDHLALSTGRGGKWLLSGGFGEPGWWFDGMSVHQLPYSCPASGDCGPATLGDGRQ